MAQMKYFYELTISSSPHIHSKTTTATIMRDVLIALVPALCGSVYFFGLRALIMVLLSCAGCVFFEWAYRRLLRLDSTVHDGSALVTGALLAFVCPVTLPYWCLLIGDFFAIVVVKQLFGGIGRNFMNPALAARAFLFSWAAYMSSWVVPGFNLTGAWSTADAVTAATPLAAMHQGSLEGVNLLSLFLGNVGGSLGETSALLLLLGAAYLLIRRVISIRIPAAYLLTVAVLTFLFPRGNDRLTWMAAQLCGGGLMLGAFFMATDYVTSPITKWGQVLFGIGCGVITVVIRYFGSYAEGVSYAILVMNACVALLDRVGRPVKFGAPKKEAVSK
ncbi:MAG: RnfABCDGE type electron transport complex subunit D [Firmicutes bacterium]|nr:RnfABCDGE type electron transport complex subunit D [Bacillota bacterium]